MSVLSQAKLRKLLFETKQVKKRLIVSPILDPDTQIGNGSIDIRLGTHFIVTRTPQIGSLDPFQSDSSIADYQEMIFVSHGQSFWIHPGTFVLGVTLEYLRLPPTVFAYVTTRSSWARLGLNIASAVAVHPGFVGCLTLELVNAGNAPVAVFPGVRIGQLVFHDSPETVVGDAKGKYFAQIVPLSARLGQERAELEKWETPT